jgi:hypothetical protein
MRFVGGCGRWVNRLRSRVELLSNYGVDAKLYMFAVVAICYLSMDRRRKKELETAGTAQ